MNDNFKETKARPDDQFELEFQQDDTNLEGYGQSFEDNGSQSESDYDYLQ